MDKITFLGAGSTVFAKNVLGDCITTDAMREFEYALYDIDHQRLEESYMMLSNINRNSNDGKAKVVKYADRLDALRGAKYVINCIQVGGYDLMKSYPDYIEFVGLCDKNEGRVETGKKIIGASCPTYTDFEKMMKKRIFPTS